MDTKDLLDLCKKAGFEIKNQLSSLEPEQRDAVLEWMRRGSSAPTPATPRTPPAVPEQRVRNLDQPRRARRDEPARAPAPQPPAAPVETAPAAAPAPPASAPSTVTPAAETN